MTYINSIFRNEQFRLANDIINGHNVGKKLSTSDQYKIYKAAATLTKIDCPNNERNQLDNAINTLWSVLQKQRIQKKKYFKKVSQIQSQIAKESKKIAKKEKTNAAFKSTLSAANTVKAPTLPPKNVMVVSKIAIDHRNLDSLFLNKKYDQVAFPDKKWNELLNYLRVESNPNITTLKISPLYDLEPEISHRNQISLTIVTLCQQNMEKCEKQVQITTETWNKIIKCSNVKVNDISTIGEIDLFVIEDIN